jgi:hypothetical protein
LPRGARSITTGRGRAPRCHRRRKMISSPAPPRRGKVGCATFARTIAR